MRYLFFPTGVFIVMAAMLYKTYLSDRLSSATAGDRITAKKKSAISCTPDRNFFDFTDPDAPLVGPLPGWGNYKWHTPAAGDSAVFYFNQGINLYYSFHIIESLASFKKAILLDSNFAMAYWGIALAYGPNINDVSYQSTPLAYQAAAKAASLSVSCSAFEKSLIESMSKRYPAQGGTPMETYNNGYALSMKQVYQSFPDRADAAALYADALMLQHPWDLYDHAQNPKPWTPELVTVLEHALRISPDHPAANHYYIHAVEASAMPGRGLPSADRLGRLLPGVAHMVHMPSHIYIRTGHYEKGTRVNEQAVKGYRDYLKQFPTVENNAFLYLFHNEHLRAACGIMNGKYDYAKAASSAVREAIPYPYLSTVPPEGEYLQYMYMTPLFSDIRYGKWNRILAEPAVADSLAYAKILDEAGRCVANARLKNFAAARKNLEQLKTVLYGQEKLKVRMGAFNSAFDGGRVAEKMAEGILAEEENRLDDAARLLQEATELEATMVYDEPKDWILPPAQFLGSVLLKAGRFREAENIFRKDLNYNPNNGWSLNGLAKALAKQGKKESLTAEEKNMLSAVQKKDFNPAGPVY